MQDALASPYLLAALFFGVAFIYSSVGLGGGSAYTALMAIFGVSPAAIPIVTLSLNVIVTSVGSFNFIRNRHARFKLIFPFLITSIPAAYLGGTLAVSPRLFYWILLISLLFVALRIYVWGDLTLHLALGRQSRLAISLTAGALLGLVSGIVGVGGGIYLVPLIIILGLGSEKEAAACGAIFIWLNSLAGLSARLQYHAIDFAPFIPLVVATLTGGTLGSFMGAARYSPRTMQKVLGGIILVAIAFLARRVLRL